MFKGDHDCGPAHDKGDDAKGGADKFKMSMVMRRMKRKVFMRMMTMQQKQSATWEYDFFLS